MTKTIANFMAAALLATTVLSVPAPAEARARHHTRAYHHSRDYNYYQRDRYRDDRGDALAAGVAGLAIGAILGAALTSDRNHRSRGYYGDGYYRDDYGGGYGGGGEWREHHRNRSYGRDYYGDGYGDDWGDGRDYGWREHRHDDDDD